MKRESGFRECELTRLQLRVGREQYLMQMWTHARIHRRFFDYGLFLSQDASGPGWTQLKTALFFFFAG